MQGPAVVLDTVSRKKIFQPTGTYTGLCWGADNRHVVLGNSNDNSLQLYDTVAGDLKRTFHGHTAPMVSHVNPSGKSLVSVGYDGTIRSWDYLTKAPVDSLSVNSNDSRRLYVTCISPRGDRIAMTSNDETSIEIWDVGLGERIHEIVKPGQFVWRIEFSSNGKQVYMGSTDGKLTRFDVASEQELSLFTGHRGEVMALAISPNEKQLVAGDSSGRIIIWDVEMSHRLITLTGSGKAVTSLDWSRDGKSIVAGRDNGTIQIWTLPWSPQ
jgi:WD40 repeat protein